MDERQKLQSDLKRYRTIRDLIFDERVVAVIVELIKETENRPRISRRLLQRVRWRTSDLTTQSPLNTRPDAMGALSGAWRSIRD